MDDHLYQNIEKLASEGISVDLIPVALVKIGWPQDLVDETFDNWMSTNGRKHIKTSFKDWLSKYHAKARKAVISVVILNTIASGIALLRPWPTKILADSVFGKSTCARTACKPDRQAGTYISRIWAKSRSILSWYSLRLHKRCTFVKDWVLSQLSYQRRNLQTYTTLTSFPPRKAQ
jgi:hypothetical protein